MLPVHKELYIVNIGAEGWNARALTGPNLRDQPGKAAPRISSRTRGYAVVQRKRGSILARE